jgi:hypothetical protein
MCGSSTAQLSARFTARMRVRRQGHLAGADDEVPASRFSVEETPILAALLATGFLFCHNPTRWLKKDSTHP